MRREDLKTLLANARARPHLPAAAAIIEAIENQLKPKGSSPPTETIRLTEAEREEIRLRWTNAPLVDRIEAAFNDRPPTKAQLDRLRILHDHPDLDETALALLANDAGLNGFNLVLGRCARDRVEYLPLPARVPGYPGPNWSAAICDLRRKDEAGRVSHGWSLKPKPSKRCYDWVT